MSSTLLHPHKPQHTRQAAGDPQRADRPALLRAVPPAVPPALTRPGASPSVSADGAETFVFDKDGGEQAAPRGIMRTPSMGDSSPHGGSAKVVASLFSK